MSEEKRTLAHNRKFTGNAGVRDLRQGQCHRYLALVYGWLRCKGELVFVLQGWQIPETLAWTVFPDLDAAQCVGIPRHNGSKGSLPSGGSAW
jgi:hypothetical protein